MLEGRTRQKTELSTFFQAINSEEHRDGMQRAVDNGAARHVHARAWLEFFKGLRAGRHSTELLKNITKRWRSVSTSAKHGSSSDKSGSSRSDSDGNSGDGARKQRKKRDQHDPSNRDRHDPALEPNTPSLASLQAWIGKAAS